MSLSFFLGHAARMSTMAGNEMPGYPRVSSVPQHSLNCNGYSGEFSGNQQNAGQQSQQNQNTPQPHQQQQQQPQPQSVQHSMHWKTDTNGVRPMESMNHWKAQTNGTRPPMDVIGQWKAQTNGLPSTQQQQPMSGHDANNKTGHFLSYSHHLRDLNTEGNLNNNSSTDMCLSSVQPNLSVEPNGGGGVPPHWKSEPKPPDDFQSPQQQGPDVSSKSKSSPKLDSEKPLKKPAPKRQRKKPNASIQSQPPAKQSTDEKKSSSFMLNYNKANDLYPSAYGANSKYDSSSSSSYMSGVHTPDPLNPYQPPEGFDQTPAKTPSSNNFMYGLPSKPLKQEPTTVPPRQPYPVQAAGPTYPAAQVKMEGYERNYQNFINYADYCQSQTNAGAGGGPPTGAAAAAAAAGRRNLRTVRRKRTCTAKPGRYLCPTTTTATSWQQPARRHFVRRIWS